MYIRPIPLWALQQKRKGLLFLQNNRLERTPYASMDVYEAVCCLEKGLSSIAHKCAVHHEKQGRSFLRR